MVVPEHAPALRLLEQIRESGEHLALVVDEYGGTAGLVTPQDLLEAIVGDIPAAGEAPDPAAVRRDDGSWLLDGTLPLDRLADLLRLGPRENPEAAATAYRILAGFALERLGRLPAPGDAFAWDGWRFEVVDMDGRRVDKVLATRLGQPAGNGGDSLQQPQPSP